MSLKASSHSFLLPIAFGHPFNTACTAFSSNFHSYRVSARQDQKRKKKMFAQSSLIRPPTKEERAELLPKVSKGWANSHEVPNGIWLDSTSIIGVVPEDLRGTFFRNGPGLNEVYGTQLAHPIDGDGIVAALSFVDGKVHFRSRFVQTKVCFTCSVVYISIRAFTQTNKNTHPCNAHELHLLLTDAPRRKKGPENAVQWKHGHASTHGYGTSWLEGPSAHQRVSMGFASAGLPRIRLATHLGSLNLTLSKAIWN